MLNKSYDIINNPKQMVPSLMETGARSYIVNFLQDYIAIGTLILIEERGIVFTFEGSKRKSPLKVYLKVHNPQFYWKIITQAELGFADAYIKGDVSFTDKNEGLLNMLMVCSSGWTPMFLTAALSNAKYIYHHVMRKNTISQARSNISQHYDLACESFLIILTTFSYFYRYFVGQFTIFIHLIYAFVSKDDDLKTAQLRKISSLIEKARVNENHEVLDIGCGWGRFGIELVKQTGCKYTGITLSKEQIKYAESKVKEAGLQVSVHTITKCPKKDIYFREKINIECKLICNQVLTLHNFTTLTSFNDFLNAINSSGSNQISTM
ncbi:putative cyclopropane-fatty-acyl-phospholipid synthase [Helianthus annuus]|nr:putative cyclopropane-fatty-acyl-phospholipid synthase [Helianthus annuus]